MVMRDRGIKLSASAYINCVGLRSGLDIKNRNACQVQVGLDYYSLRLGLGSDRNMWPEPHSIGPENH